MVSYLNKSEIATLRLQKPETRSNGGFQSLLIKLQEQTDFVTGRIFLFPKDMERIFRYCHKYNNGGWQNMLISIFGRIMPLA